MNRHLIETVHAAAVLAFVLVFSTGALTVPGFLLWLLICAGGDQLLVWSLWFGGGRKGVNPNRGWF